ncbi:MAG: hypothetical protein A2172_03695 [Candidatus Woykebacteria bacterium RBG_13_40_15]|uniref:Short-chain dehydrogenase n=1 Tax=Candidatus Woykebacteria bacterium RBG_13_40_15 TaxID=1802593 RepID=A0A1G1WBG4_9BACT|nr:MAG: hypothetical protein A2172_03695 [Candidatus Woykebacteria bacterium RBG_13_40_15]
MRALENKNAIITGGARGFGRAITERFIADGAKVLICSRTIEELKKTSKEIDPSGKSLYFVEADVSNHEVCQKLFTYTKKVFKTLDILVNNAGIYGPVGSLETNSPKDWLKTIEINLMGTVYCTRLALEQMKNQKHGKIINLAGAGVGGKKPLSRFSAYYTSKAAVAAFTEVVASEVANYNIQVNCISPGAINTYFTDYLIAQGPEKAGPMYEQALKQKETGGDSPELGANLASFLASGQSDNVTGKTLSAKWDKISNLKKLSLKDSDKYTLRRIDEGLFGEK